MPAAKQIAIPTPKPKAIVDPTGCGDAYRAGLLYGIQKGWDWETTGRLASLMGSLKIASRGGQNHSYYRATNWWACTSSTSAIPSSCKLLPSFPKLPVLMTMSFRIQLMETKLLAHLSIAISDATHRPFTLGKSTPVGGGSINDAYRLEGTDGARYFLKLNDARHLPMFVAEAQGWKQSPRPARYTCRARLHMAVQARMAAPAGKAIWCWNIWN